MATDSSRKTLERLALFVATGFGSGCLPIAPGTWGSVIGVFYFIALTKTDSLLPGIFLGLVIAVLSAHLAEPSFDHKDPRQIVVDELACFPLAMLWLPVTFPYLAAAFVLFRILDVLKPPPIRSLQSLPGGWGIVADDVAAALAACAILHGFHWLTGLQGVALFL